MMPNHNYLLKYRFPLILNDKKAYTEFLESNERCNFQQSLEWGRVKQAWKNEIILSKDGKEKFIKELDKRMRTTVNHRHLGRNVSYRRLIRLELYKIQKHILGEDIYRLYQALW